MYLAIIGLVFVFQRHLMYSPGRVVPTPADVGVPEMDVVFLPTIDGLVIESWYAKSASGKSTIIFFHGNAGTLADRAYKARLFMDAGYGVVLAGYRGFGRNDGKPTEQGLYRDAQAVFNFLENEDIDSGDKPGGLVLYGESLGSGIAVQMAREFAELADATGANRITGVILEAPFTSMSDAANYHYPWLPTQILVWDRFDSIEKISSIGVPLLVIHGRKDRTVPFEQGEKLFSVASDPKQALWLSDAGHVDVYDFGAGEHVLRWLGDAAMLR